VAYFITVLSYVPKYSPRFRPINEDGTEYDRGTIVGLEGGRLLDETTYPTLSSIYRVAKMIGRSKTLPDIFRAGQEVCVNQSLRDAVESLEPNVHQFLPITLLRTKDMPFAGSYYLLNITQTLNSVVFEKSNLRWEIAPNGKSLVQPGLNPADYRTLRKAEIKGRHLWREKVYLPDIYMSDELFNLFKLNKFTGIDAHGYKVAEEI
jgi:hypothetical protein